MSLHKTYRVRCDGISLAARLGLLKSGPGVLFHDHQDFGPSADAAAKARRLGISQGWTRHPRELPITGTPNGPTSVITFDLCPSCTKTVGSK